MSILHRVIANQSMHIFVIIILLWLLQVPLVLLCYGAFKINERITMIEEKEKHGLQIVSRLKA
jgi:hypothetical protein